MKIIYISDAELPSRSANSVQIIKMCNAFIENGHQVELYGKKGLGEDTEIDEYYEKNSALKITTIPFTKIKLLGNIIFSYRLASKAIKNTNIDLFFGRYSYGLFQLKDAGIPITYEAHTLPKRRLHRYMENEIFKSPYFKSLVVISNELKEDYIEEFPILRKANIIVAHDGADIKEHHHTIKNENNHLKNRNIGYVGNLYPGKGMEIILELAKRMPSFSFHVVGGKESDLKYWRSKSVGCNNIIFHGFVPNKNLHKYYERFDIALAPYQEQVKSLGGQNLEKWMSPLKIFEYMAYKKAIIASDLITIREVLTHGENCLLCKTDNLEEWIEAIEILSGDNDLRSKISLTGFEELKNRYTWKERAIKVLK